MSNEPVGDRLSQIGAALRSEPSVSDEVVRRIRTESARRSNSPSLFKLVVALAACVVLTIVLIPVTASMRASAAFAAAIDQVAKAHTFSCRQITQDVDEKGKLEIHETTYWFKEPDRSRVQYSPDWMGNETVITDYSKKRRLTLIPHDKVADLQDTSDMYAVNPKTGDLEPVKLDTDVRDEVMKLTAEAVKDLGERELNGKKVGVLQSRGKETVRTIFVDPQTRQPVQIVIERPSNPQSQFTYTDIRIDQEIDDKLFGLDVPEGYKLFREGLYVPTKAYYSKLMTKIMRLNRACMMYANDHNGEYPAKIEDLKGVDDISEAVLAKLLSSPDKPNAPTPAIVYRQPRKGKDYGTEIVLYEAEPQRRDGKVAVGVWDGHAEVMTQKQFDELMK